MAKGSGYKFVNLVTALPIEKRIDCLCDFVCVAVTLYTLIDLQIYSLDKAYIVRCWL